MSGNVTSRSGTSACISYNGDLVAGGPTTTCATAIPGVLRPRRMAFAATASHVYVDAGAYSPVAGTTDAITLFDRAADGTLTRRGTPTAADGCIAWNAGPHSAGSCRTAARSG